MPGGDIACYCHRKLNLVTNKGQVFYGQEPPSGQIQWEARSLPTECGVNYQLLAVITEVSQWKTPSCSRPQPATDNVVGDGWSNFQVATLTLIGSTPWAPRIARCERCLQIARLVESTRARTDVHGMADQRTTCAATQSVIDTLTERCRSLINCIPFLINFLYNVYHHNSPITKLNITIKQCLTHLVIIVPAFRWLTDTRADGRSKLTCRIRSSRRTWLTLAK